MEKPDKKDYENCLFTEYVDAVDMYVEDLESQLKERDEKLYKLMSDNGDRQLRIEQLEDQIKNLKD